MRGAALLVALTGCNEVFGIEETLPLDASEPPVVRCFSDSFEDGVIDTALWTEISPGAQPMFREQDGELQAPIAAGQVGYNGWLSVPFDMVDGTLSARMTPGYLPGFTDVELVVDAAALATFFFTIGVNSLNVHSNVNNVGSSTSKIGYSAEVAYVRVRHESATKMMHMETSPDAVTWTLRHSRDMPYMPAAAQLTLLVGSFEGPNMSTVPASSTAAYDSIQVLAPGCVP